MTSLQHFITVLALVIVAWPFVLLLCAAIAWPLAGHIHRTQQEATRQRNRDETLALRRAARWQA